jgi:enoyl-CoA hydratase/carnithine racemase
LTVLADYRTKYECAKLERRDGVLCVTLHTNGDSLRWSLPVHRDLPDLFHDIGQDRENKAVILTGTGAEFTGPRVMTDKPLLFKERMSFETADTIIREGKAGMMNFLNIDVPIVSALNGPAWRHGEMPLLADIVIATDTVKFQDSAHFPGGQVPGDGMHVVMPLLLGANRGRYFLLMGQVIDAQKALELGLVSEVVAADKLMPRAWEIASMLAGRPRALVRLSRQVLTEELKRRAQDLLAFGLYAELLQLSYLDES